MEQCKLFSNCDAALCHLDSDLNKRIWYSDESICRSRKFGQHRWIKKQRSIRKKQTKSWLNRAVTHQEIYDASRKRKLSDEQLEEIRARMGKYNAIYAKNTKNNQIELNGAVF